MKASDIRKGIVVMHNGAPHRIMDFHHHTPGTCELWFKLKCVTCSVEIRLK